MHVCDVWVAASILMLDMYTQQTDRIAVLPQRSTSLTPNDGLVPAAFDLVISELLDSTLLAEGYLASLRDLARRGFLTAGECV